MISSFNRRS